MPRLVLCAAIAAAVLAGCGDDGSAPSTTTISVPPVAETTTASESTAPVPPDDSAGTPEQADDPGADRPRSVEDVITAVMTASEKPEVICDGLVTPKYVQTAYGDREGCIAAQKPGALADSIEAIEQGTSSDESVTAVAIPKGGPYDGAEVEITLLPATDLEDAWVVDSLVADVPAGP
jgi:hypothetical protein